MALTSHAPLPDRFFDQETPTSKPWGLKRVQVSLESAARLRHARRTHVGGQSQLGREQGWQRTQVPFSGGANCHSTKWNHRGPEIDPRNKYPQIGFGITIAYQPTHAMRRTCDQGVCLSALSSRGSDYSVALPNADFALNCTASEAGKERYSSIAVFGFVMVPFFRKPLRRNITVGFELDH